MWKFVEHPYTALSSMCLFAMTTYLLLTEISEVNRTPLSESDYPPMAILFVMYPSSVIKQFWLWHRHHCDAPLLDNLLFDQIRLSDEECCLTIQ
ncbi:hypothetical protein MtrunA17_Chr1g0176991 [Medicago truncatula]|uniref:Transmembrane protein n=1 Tax=Medicago truncatula TaxID=3880 RepID=G7I7Z9_MEDTR|nr:hypothetical protein MTR_1g056240 [Medicago truncatula]RHN79404.1 hypothetical protein MtrunA17_Chr1g0176991 [Medicago truncatula]